MKVSIKTLPHAEGLALPSYATAQSAGLDLLAANTDTMILSPNLPILVPTGISIALPDGYEAQIRPRSGLALKSAISLVNAPGTIDADYRGEIGVIMINHGTKDFQIERGMRIAQMVIAKYERIEWNPVAELDETIRGEGGFGSTGTGAPKAA